MSSTSSSAAGQKASRAGGYSAAATSTGGAGESSSPLAELLPKLPAGQVQDAFAALRIAHVAEVSASVGQPGGQYCLQYEANSGFASDMASVMSCAAMLKDGVPRPPAPLWEFDWQEAGRDLEPAEDTVTALGRQAARLVAGGKLEDELARALWKEMNRMPHLWVAADDGKGPCNQMAGLEQLRRCVRAIAALAAPRPQPSGAAFVGT
eukprot:TRINITY_DN34242_c0_g2_i3.p1 TRINITY_DN34242_c0_g2~~TRINITY_DN34242_c0_g2_i3.p1  ORF type:complete len:208 (-),score=40.66 TRINITY_DN34242_c0_g2_i3:157-780(-)